MIGTYRSTRSRRRRGSPGSDRLKRSNLDAAAVPATAGEVHRQLITNVQVLRFIAATMVLVKHSVEIFYPIGNAILVFPWNGGVDLFFVISGFIMARLTRDRFGNAKDRAVSCCGG